MKTRQPNGSQILVVDDEGLIRWSLKEGLSAAGYEVLEADTGKRALDRLRDGVDLVLLDYRLPDIDGLEVAEEIRQARLSCPVIMMTGHGSPELRRQAEDLNIVRVVDKPFDLTEMVDLVSRTLEATRPERDGPPSSGWTPCPLH